MTQKKTIRVIAFLEAFKGFLSLAAATGLFARPINFQVAHHDIPAIGDTEIDERVGHEHADRVKHVRVVVAVGHHQQGLRFFHKVHGLAYCPAVQR